MIAGKQSATLSDWAAIPSEAEPAFFIGTVTGHPRQEEFSKPHQRTSKVVNYDRLNGIVETMNTIYVLKEPSIP